jgi:putative endonuclease
VSPQRDRKGARRFGLRAETIALFWLVLRGYRVLGRNFSAPGGEIDLIAIRGRTICFIEVKARATLDEARTAITPQKRHRIIRAVRVWISRNRWSSGYTLRADAIFIAPRRWPRHLVGAFELELMDRPGNL